MPGEKKKRNLFSRGPFSKKNNPVSTRDESPSEDSAVLPRQSNTRPAGSAREAPAQPSLSTGRTRRSREPSRHRPNGLPSTSKTVRESSASPDSYPQPPASIAAGFHAGIDATSHSSSHQIAGRLYEQASGHATDTTSPLSTTPPEAQGSTSAGCLPPTVPILVRKQHPAAANPSIHDQQFKSSALQPATSDQGQVTDAVARGHDQRAGLLSPHIEKSKGKFPLSSSSHKRNPAPIINKPGPRGPLLPRKITVFSSFTFFEQSAGTDKEKHDEFDWTVSENYTKLVPTKIREKVQDAYQVDQTYSRYGSCRVVGPPSFQADGFYAFLDDEEVLSQEAIRNICGFVYKYPNKPFSLEVYWDFGFVKLQHSLSQTYADMIEAQMRQKLKINFMNLRYIPRCDLDPFLTVDVVEKVVEEDAYLQLDDDARGHFIKRIVDKASKLFAICVFLRLNMRHLRHLVEDHNFSDDPSNHPKPNKGTDSCDEYCHTRILHILEHLPRFFVRNITRDFQHLNLEHDDVLPLFHTGECDADGQPSIERLGEGEGAHGKVYKVKIDRPHYRFSGDPSGEFAVKEFSSRRLFEREKAMLQELADFPDDHILLHIITWTQRDVHYILYDKARCSLRGYLRDTNRPELTNSVVIWFLSQLKGLAKAIQHVHNFKKPTRSDPNPEDDDKWGRHNDIKPENILVFETVEGHNPVFKITDFGHGILNDAKGKKVSDRDPKAQGTRSYWSPEAVRKFDELAGVSRPTDMWALGCVFLELLLWLFGFYQEPDKAGFSTEREKFPGHDPESSDDMFWCDRPGPGEEPTPTLRPVVAEVLDNLEGLCYNMRAFEKVIRAIRKLLEIYPAKRWNAEKLARKMGEVVGQTDTRLGLVGVDDFYQCQYLHNQSGSEVDAKLSNELLDPEAEGTPTLSRSHSDASS